MKQACRDESIASLFFYLSQYIYIIEIGKKYVTFFNNWKTLYIDQNAHCNIRLALQNIIEDFTMYNNSFKVFHPYLNLRIPNDHLFIQKNKVSITSVDYPTFSTIVYFDLVKL